MPEDDTKSHLRLAVENKQADVDGEWARQQIRWPLRELAANVIRVVRGAGKSYEIAGQCVAVIEAFQRYREKVGCWPASWEIDEALSISRDDENAKYDDVWEREQNRETIIRGSLQTVASRLVFQNTQEQRGRSEMMEGVNSIFRMREKERIQRALAERAQRLASKAKKTSRKKPATVKAKQKP